MSHSFHTKSPKASINIHIKHMPILDRLYFKCSKAASMTSSYCLDSIDSV